MYDAAHGSPGDPHDQDSSRDASSSVLTSELGEAFRMEAYSPLPQTLPVDMDFEPHLVHSSFSLLRPSPFASAANMPAIPPSQAPVPHTRSHPSVSPFALTADSSMPFEGGRRSTDASPQASGSFPFLPPPPVSDAELLELQHQRPPLLGFGRAASDGASLLRKRPLEESTLQPSLAMRRTTLSRPPLASRALSVPHPCADLDLELGRHEGVYSLSDMDPIILRDSLLEGLPQGAQLAWAA